MTDRPDITAAQAWISGAARNVPDRPPAEFRPDEPSIARRYNGWLGGQDNFPADRAVAESVQAVFPTIGVATRENRRFLQRVVRQLADAGIRQFLDVGCGLPEDPNVHEIAQGVDPTCRVVYVDHDVEVVTHARALLTGDPRGSTHCVHADLRDPGRIRDAAHAVLDPDRPVAVLLVAVTHFLPGDDTYQRVTELVDGFPSGSYLAVSHATSDWMPQDQATAVESAIAQGGPFTLRTKAQIERFLDGLDLVPPGLVPPARWGRSGSDDPHGDAPPDPDVAMWAGLGRKP